MAALEVLENTDIVCNSFRLGEKFRRELSEKLDKCMVIDVRGKGLLNAIVLNISELVKMWYCFMFNYFVVSDNCNAWDLLLKLKENGVIAKHTHDNIIRFSPALVITEEQLEESIEIIVKTINNC